MKTVDLHQVDAFTGQLFGGNPAGVVTNAQDLSEPDMRKIAREMNLSETAFVLPPSSANADIRLRYFSPAAEIDFCGHATVGTLSQLATLHLYKLGETGENPVRVETKAGILSMSVTNEAQEALPRISFTAPPVAMTKYRLQGKDFADTFGIPIGVIDPKSVILIDRKLNYVYTPVISIKALGDLSFDFARIRQQFGEEQIVVFALYTKETLEPGSDLHARGLAPIVGVDEDPFTGSMQSGLIHAAKENDYLPGNKRHIRTEQGHSIGRPGFASVRHDPKTDETLVSATAVPVFSTRLVLPDA